MRTPDLSKAFEQLASIIIEKEGMAQKERQAIERVNRA